MSEPQYKTHRPITVHIDADTIERCDEAWKALGMKSRTQFINMALNAAILDGMKQVIKEKKR